jgi:short subunit dehydrogenase-like uncharacterized protein
MSASQIAVYGATGHTGRLVAAQLVDGGHDVVLAGRDREGLQSVARELGSAARTEVVPLDDPGSMLRMAAQAAVVINCAGPFSSTGRYVAAAAVQAGCHYIDHAAEPVYVRQLFDAMSVPAEEAQSLVLPAMSFYGGIADLLADVVGTGLTEIDTLTVAYAVAGWRMTTTSKLTAHRLMEGERVRFVDGDWRVEPFERTLAHFDFPAPVHRRQVIVHYPAAEVVTIPRHVPVAAVEVLMTADTFQEPSVFTSEHIDAESRADSSFTILARAVADGRSRTAWVRGRDLYGAGAAMAAEAVDRIVDGRAEGPRGVRAPAEVFPAADVLKALERRGALQSVLLDSVEERR